MRTEWQPVRLASGHNSSGHSQITSHSLTIGYNMTSGHNLATGHGSSGHSQITSHSLTIGLT